jgi:asparagine synthase (glutamine-hydrolysing)
MQYSLTQSQMGHGHFVLLSLRAAADRGLDSWSARMARVLPDANVALSGWSGLWACRSLPFEKGEALAVLGRQPNQISAANRQPVSLAAVADQWRRNGPPGSDDFTAPFSLVGLDLRDGTATAITDHVGLGHLYLHSGDGVAAASSSALLLARLFGLKPALESLLGLGLVGAFVGDDSGFEGAAKLTRGHVAVLQEGRVTTRRSSRPYEPSREDGATVWRSIVGELAQAFPGAEVELSGGLDSRLILAGIPSAQRAQHPAFTLGAADSPDGHIAVLLATRSGMPHKLVDPADLIDDRLTQHLKLTALGDQFGSNPLDRSVFTHLEESHQPAVRFTGQNGEIMRGFYYAYQQLDAQPSVAKARALINTRLIVNDLVDPSLFRADWYRNARARIKDRLTASILDAPGDRWADKIDWLYLHERMHRWAGVAFSKVQAERQILAPYFDRRFIEYAFGQRPADKLDSRATARLLMALDPEMARIPLDWGVTPADIAHKSVGSALARYRFKLWKIRRKLKQYFSGGSLTEANTDEMGGQWGRRGGPSDFRIDALAAWSIFDPKAIDDFMAGRRKPNWATLGFILNCATLAEGLEA